MAKMRKREEQRKLKLCVLSKMKEIRNVLFAHISKNGITKEMKTSAWKEVCDYAKSIGAIGPDKDHKYLRDIWFPNVKRGVTEKVEKNSEKTVDSEGDSSKPITEYDEFIMDVIGMDLGKVEDEATAELKKKKLELMKQNVEKASYLKSIQEDGLEFITQSTKKGSHLKSFQAEDVLIPLKKKKLQLMIENLEKDSYLKSLQIVKMERELELPASNFTLSFQEENLVQEENVVYLTTDENAQTIVKYK